MAAAQDANEEVDINPEAEGKKSGSMKMIIIAVAALAVVGASVGLTVLLLGDDDAAEPAAEMAAETGKSGEADTAATQEQNGTSSTTLPSQAPIYQALEPPFTVNFENDGRIHYAQITIEVMARDQAVIDAVKTHMPLVRNNLLLRLSDLDYALISIREGREQLRKELLEVLRETLKTETQSANVEQLYFTSFVMQ